MSNEQKAGVARTYSLQLTAYGLNLTAYGLLLAVLLLAGVLRFWQLGSLPLGLYHDEAYNGLDALSLVEGRVFPLFYEGWELYANEAHAANPPWETRFPIFFEGNYGREPLHVYLMALSVALFGPTPWALRFVLAVAGVLGVLTTYLVASALFHKPRGDAPLWLLPLLSAWALAVLYPAVHFSRFGLRSMLFVPVATLCVYFFWRGIDAHARSNGFSRFVAINFVVAGFLLGLGLYVYAAGRLFPLLFVGFVLLWFGTQKGALRRWWQPIGLMAGVAGVTALPLLLYFARYPYFFFFRSAYVANKGAGTFEGRPWLTWLVNVGRVIAGLFWAGESHFRHNLPTRPFMDLIQAALFLLGGVDLLRRRLTAPDEAVPDWLRTAVFPLLWLFVMLLPTMLSGDAPHFGRMTGAMPVVAIFIGVGGTWLYQTMRQRLTATVTTTVLISLLAVSTLWTSYDYFVRYANHPLMQVDFYWPDWEAGQALAQAGQGRQMLYLSPTQEEIATFLFALNRQRDNLRNLNADQSSVALGRADELPLYLVQNESLTAVLANLRPLYGDQLTLTPLTRYTLIEPTAPASLPITPPQTIGEITLLAHLFTPEGVTLVWQPTAVLPTDYTAFVHLLNAEGEIIAQLDRPPAGYPTSDWRPGERVLDRFALSWPQGEGEERVTAVRTGFYDPLTLQPLGEPILLPWP
jgi:4-amino-4-deoxy-L-arabinose transferase-like glycosyltransferase